MSQIAALLHSELALLQFCGQACFIEALKYLSQMLVVVFPENTEDHQIIQVGGGKIFRDPGLADRSYVGM